MRPQRCPPPPTPYAAPHVKLSASARFLALAMVQSNVLNKTWGVSLFWRWGGHDGHDRIPSGQIPCCVLELPWLRLLARRGRPESRGGRGLLQPMLDRGLRAGLCALRKEGGSRRDPARKWGHLSQGVPRHRQEHPREPPRPGCNAQYRRRPPFAGATGLPETAGRPARRTSGCSRPHPEHTVSPTRRSWRRWRRCWRVQGKVQGKAKAKAK